MVSAAAQQGRQLRQIAHDPDSEECAKEPTVAKDAHPEGGDELEHAGEQDRQRDGEGSTRTPTRLSSTATVAPAPSAVTATAGKSVAMVWLNTSTTPKPQNVMMNPGAHNVAWRPPRTAAARYVRPSINGVT